MGSRDRDEFRTIVESHARAVFHLAYRIAGNRDDAEDIVQETFLRAWKQREKFNGRAAFGTWLHSICANCAYDLLRARARRRETPETAWADADRAPGPERLAMSGQVADRLVPALEELSEAERTAFVLRHYEGMGIEEIARTLGVQNGAAKHSVFRAVQKLRRALEPAHAGAER